MSQAIVGATHDHLHLRGQVRLPSGRWMSLAEYSGRYTPEQAEVYARCLAEAMRGQEGPTMKDAYTVLASWAVGSHGRASAVGPRRPEGSRPAAHRGKLQGEGEFPGENPGPVKPEPVASDEGPAGREEARRRQTEAANAH